MTQKVLWEKSGGLSNGMTATLNDTLDNYDEIILIGKISISGNTAVEVKRLPVSILIDSKFLKTAFFLSVPGCTYHGDKTKLTLITGTACAYYEIIGIKY